MDLSIIIPTYNRNSSVVECVLALDHNECDIIVVDDASDEPVTLPAGTCRVIRHDRHSGRAAAINTGLKAALHDLVLVIDDDIFAAPDMVTRLVADFAIQDNPKLALTARVTWDPDLPLTLTMRWVEQAGKFSSPILFWRPFVLDHGGYDENIAAELGEFELQLRLKPHGLDVRSIESAVGFQNKVVKIRDLIEVEIAAGAGVVYLHSKFPDYLPQLDDLDLLLRNRRQSADAEAAVEEIALLEQGDSKKIPSGAFDLFAHVCRYYFLSGALDRLQDIGGTKAKRTDAGTLAIYREASHLENIDELDEARRLFRLVLLRSAEYGDGAEYHLGCIESRLGNDAAAHMHFTECLKKNPRHYKARRELNKSDRYIEVAPNVFQAKERTGTTKVLFVVFGDLADVINAFPVVAAVRREYGSETVWLTLSEFATLAAASGVDAVREVEHRGIIPWNWVQSEGFTHVFYPEAGANHDEWTNSGLHPIDFMAWKCGVELNTHRTTLELPSYAVGEAEAFMQRHKLSRNAFLTASQRPAAGRHWPHSNLLKLSHHLDAPTVVFCEDTARELPGTIPCFEERPAVIAALIQSSGFFIGSECGHSWLATTTDTPMVVFMDPLRQAELNVGLRNVLRREKDNIEELSIYTNLQTVLQHVKQQLVPKEADFVGQCR